MHYVDTSAIVAMLAYEQAGSQIRTALQGKEAEGLMISSWVVTEVSSALSLKIRTGELTVQTRAAALAQWQAIRESSFAELPVDAEAFYAAARYATRHELSLRAGDALHLAICAANGCTLVTLDERMAKAALELGVPVIEI